MQHPKPWCFFLLYKKTEQTVTSVAFPLTFIVIVQKKILMLPCKASIMAAFPFLWTWSQFILIFLLHLCQQTILQQYFAEKQVCLRLCYECPFCISAVILFFFLMVNSTSLVIWFLFAEDQLYHIKAKNQPNV